MPPLLYLIDGHALAYRTYFALSRAGGSFTTRTGEPTGGVFGFTSVLLKILEQEDPEYLAVVFDTGRTFRDDIFPAYKGTRAKMPDDLRPQIERIRQLVDAFNIPRIERDNYEADDVLGSLARWAVAQGLGVKIITGDRDLLQLVTPRIIVNLPGKSLADARDYLPDDVKEYLGVRPDQVVDFKALVGDKSDNIPGVPGVGDKGAVTLLDTYDTLDNIYAHLDELSAGLRKKLEAGRESALMSRKLAAIVQDLDVEIDLEAARPHIFDPAQIESLFRELEFRGHLQRLRALEERYGQRKPAVKGQQLNLFETALPAIQAPQPPPVVRQVTVVDSPETLQALLNALHSASILSFDTETTGTDPMQADLVSIALSTEPGVSWYIPLGHLNARQLPLHTVLDALRPAFTNPNLPKAGHNIKYDFIMLARYGLRPAGLGFDSMIAGWLVDPASRHLGLKDMADERLGIEMTPISDLIGKGKKQITMAEVPVDQAAAYAGADAEVVLRLKPGLEDELQERNASALLRDLEMPLVEVLADMEMNGVALDVPFLQEMSAGMGAQLAQIETEIYTHVGMSFNLNSPQQLSDALFNRLGLLPPDRTAKTASGFYSTAAEVLEALSGKHPVVDLVLEYRELSKLKSTYLDALPLQVNPRTGRVHTSYNQTGSVTGRIASSEPNLQNIPIRTEAGRRVRRAFVADPGHTLLSVDYSQVELRIVAHLASDQAMLDTFRRGLDIHAATAAAIYAIPLEQVTKEDRRRAKGINFGLIYGISAFGLMRQTDLTLAESENFMQAYFRQFPGVKAYLDGMRRLAAEQGYVETVLGRRRYFPGLQTQSNVNLRNRMEREAINAPVQGSAADIMKLAMLHVPQALRQAGLQTRILLQVHDELVLECPDAELAAAAALVQDIMEKAYTLSVPLQTDARYGRNWGEMVPLGA